jgi:hypothetical protein
MSQTTSSAPRRIVWESVITVLSAAVLIGFGDYGVYTFQILFFLAGVAVMIAFVRNGMRVEAFTTRK